MEKISEAISAVASGNHDSAFAATKHETYAWYKDKPLNFDPSVMAQTQLLSPVYLETSGFYVFRRSLFVEHSRRVGFSPKIIELGIKESIDIDNPSDFALAQHMLNYNEEILPLDVPPFLFGTLGKSSAHGQIKHVSFDLDGVLVDTIPVMKEAWESVCRSFSLTVKFDEYKKLIGIPFKDILQRLGVVPEIWDDVQKSYVEMSCLYSGYMRRFDGVSELLNFVLKSDLSVSVVTSKPRERATAVLKQIMPASLKYCLVCPEDVPSGRGKPSPDPLLFACCQLGVDPSTSVYIGDMDVDREAASRAKFYFVHACWGYEQLSESNEIWFSTPLELKDYLEEVVS